MTRVGAGLQRRVLETLSDARNYNAWLADAVQPFLGEDPIEIGAGLGTFTQLWLDAGTPHVTATEIDPTALEALRRRFEGEPRVTVGAVDLTDAEAASYTGLVALNVLEHIEDDVSALRNAARLVRGGGAVAILVPAFPLAMSRFDRAIGHHRRYTVDTLREAFARAGLVDADVRYLNAPGLPAWLVAMRLLRLSPQNGVLVRAWDRGVVPLARALESRLALPFGQSVLGVARSPAHR